MTNEFIYIGDPMCSWCWGFAPVLTALQKTHPAIPLQTIVGGLRPGKAARHLDDEMRTTLNHHWEAVAQASGQAFNFEALERQNWIYDTELPARAVVTMRRLRPEQTFACFARLQRAFYTEAIDITDPATYPALLDTFAVNSKTFVSTMTSEEVREATYQDFALTRRLGIHGFPALILKQDDTLSLVSNGYQPFETLNTVLTNQLQISKLS